MIPLVTMNDSLLPRQWNHFMAYRASNVRKYKRPSLKTGDAQSVSSREFVARNLNSRPAAMTVTVPFRAAK